MIPALVTAEILLAERQIRECGVCDRPCRDCQRTAQCYPPPGCYVCRGRGGRASGDDRCRDCRSRKVQ